MDSVLQIGPLVLPWTLLIFVVGWQLGHWVHERLARRQGLASGPHAWRLTLAALLAARLGFVLQYPAEYGAAPWSALDIRDGGWQPWAGLAAALLYLGLLWLRRSPWRRPTLAGLATFMAIWIVGLALLQATAPQRGTALPDWRGVALDARNLALSELRGRPVVINLWASWCPPCRREMPVLLQASRSRPDVRFVWINQGEAPEAALRYASQQGLPLADVLLDGSSQLSRELGHKALPTTLFYDAQGRLQAVRAGELSGATLARLLAQVTAGQR
ncbi:MAG: TlpA family protein disulfide reductase [Proteobacteria bacterium]|nr:TlpA family protein disulfide reductase [Pseudomonadota bacterium]